MENKFKKFDIYEPLLGAMCEQDDRTAGKLIKLISDYMLHDAMPKTENQDRAELMFGAYFRTIKTYKRQRRKKGLPHIIVYSAYAKFFLTMPDDETGRLLKRITDETLRTSYLDDAGHEKQTERDYKFALALCSQHRSECVSEGINAKRDYGKIKSEFRNIKWNGFNENEEPFKSVDCVKLYEYISKLPRGETYEIAEIVYAFLEDWR